MCPSGSHWLKKETIYLVLFFEHTSSSTLYLFSLRKPTKILTNFLKHTLHWLLLEHYKRQNFRSCFSVCELVLRQDFDFYDLLGVSAHSSRSKHLSQACYKCAEISVLSCPIRNCALVGSFRVSSLMCVCQRGRQNHCVNFSASASWTEAYDT